MISKIIQKIKEELLNEATTTNGSRGSYNPPLRPGLRKWLKNSNDPYWEPVSNYVDANNYYDSLDGKMSKNNKNIKKKESIAKKLRDKDYNISSKDEGDDEYAYAPFKITSQKVNKNKKSVPVNEWIEITDQLITEDLGVWFGTKKKPKGSSQPKGPWVNICKKVDGKHPPCGRSQATDKSYPKCRAAGVAGKMSDSQKRAACSQKRRAEKTHPKTGTGNKPKMVSYKPRKK